MLQSLGQYDKAKKYLQKALAIRTAIGEINGKRICYVNRGTVLQSLGQYDKAKEYYQKALVILTETGDREAVGSCYENLVLCSSHSGYTTKSITKKRLLFQLKLATEEEKDHVMEI